jgi:hypothetical protein
MRPDDYKNQDGCWNCKFVRRYLINGWYESNCGIIDADIPPIKENFKNENDFIYAMDTFTNDNSVNDYGKCEKWSCIW